MTEGLFLSQADSRPMYLQIIEQVKLKVLAGDWPPGHPLPSIRELAAATKVSVITVKRAYAELEQEGIVFTRAGLGSFVSDDDALQVELRRTEISKHINALLSAAEHCGLSDSEVLAQIQKAIDQRKKGEDSAYAKRHTYVGSDQKL